VSNWTARLICSALLAFACVNLSGQESFAQLPSPRPERWQLAEMIYDGGLRPGWQDWGWGAHEISAGPARINFSNYGGWILHHDSQEKNYDGLAFRMFAQASYGQFLQVQVANGNEAFPAVIVRADHMRKLPDGWVEVYLPWVELNPSAQPFDRITIHANVSVGSEWVLFDKLLLTQFDSRAALASAANSASKPAMLSVDCRAAGHRISPYIYGIAGPISDLSATASRWGGNPTTRYNWQLRNANNVGKDWYFENGKASDYREFLSFNRSRQVFSALTIPIIGWVAKDNNSVGFPISTYGPQRTHDPYRADAGDGIRPDGVPIRPGSPTLTSVPAPPEMMQKWVEAITREDRPSRARSVGMYILDNEPNLWNTTHRDVHPDPLTYEELLDRTIRYGTAIRAADPDALIAGPAEWGWTGYFYSAQDVAKGINLRPDRFAHGDMPLLPWYLKQLQEYEQKTGLKVLDVLDVHFYPQADKVYGTASDSASASLRLRSTRSLWDPSYKDESWINDTIRLIPRLKEWISQNYPGLKISIGEYNFGGEQHISGALALAEVLGRFGTEGVDYAFYWFMPPKNSPAAWAFRAYRDFDGKGGHFLSRSMKTLMTTGVSLFASRDESGQHLVLVALNFDPKTARNTKILLDGCAPIATRKKFVYFAGAEALIEDSEKAGGELDETLTPYSINVFDIMLK
jgi:Glycoside hydrolase family 44